MTQRLSKLLIVGAGPVGLAMADALRQEQIAYEQVDANASLGGLWYKGIYSTVHIVSSKRSTAYADYPMPASYPDFPSGAEMLAYLNSYAHQRNLHSTIEFNKSVVAAVPNAGDTWQVDFKDGERRIYKGVVICNGHHWHPVEPELPGRFTGARMHASAYRQPADLAGKRVLVIGAGNSGCDIASEAARIARSADWSMRSGAWFLPKMAFGRPLTDLPIWNLPLGVQRRVLKLIIRLMIGDYRSYGLPIPKHELFERHPTFGTEALGYVRQGRLRPRPGIVRCDGERVYFQDGTKGEYDLIVTATGYRVSLPFLPEGLVEVKSNVAQIYGGAFPAGIKNLYIIGSEQPRNGFGSLLTPATRLFARMMMLQDEFAHPIGSVLKFGGEKIPPAPFIDPARARRQIAWGHRLLPILRIEARMLARRAPYRPIALDLQPPVAYREAAE